MKTKIGIIYCLTNIAWLKYKKLGRTSQMINKRVCNLQTSLLENCEIINTTDILLDTYFYEFLLKKILHNYRLRNDREFFDVSEDDIKLIFDFFNELNNYLNTEEKLNQYIIYQFPEYLKNKKRSFQNNSNSSVKLKKKKGIYIDTRY